MFSHLSPFFQGAATTLLAIGFVGLAVAVSIVAILVCGAWRGESQ